jgi:hypothetical protein
VSDFLRNNLLFILFVCIIHQIEDGPMVGIRLVQEQGIEDLLEPHLLDEVVLAIVEVVEEEEDILEDQKLRHIWILQDI